MTRGSTAPHSGLSQRRCGHRSDPPLRRAAAHEDESVWVTFNREIYNFRELRTGLEERGHQFRTDTDTDTEVIVHLHEECRSDCVQYILDMFAFALWDARKSAFWRPRSQWFAGSLLPLPRDTLLDETSRPRGLFNFELVKWMIDQNASGERDWSSRLWALLSLELWFRHLIDRSPAVERWPQTRAQLMVQP